MDNILMVFGTCLLVIGTILLGVYLNYKKIDVKGILTKLGVFLSQAEIYTESLESLSTGKVKRALEFAELIEKASEKGIGYAAQLLISGQISDDEDGTKRKEVALNYIYALLQKHNIDIDNNVKTIATGIVESGILSNKNIDEINAQIDKLTQGKITSLQIEKETIQTQLQTLQTQLLQVTTERDNLKNTISTITNATTNAVNITTPIQQQ